MLFSFRDFVKQTTNLTWTVILTLNLLPTLMKPSLPALCFESLVVLEFSNSSRTNLSFDSHTKLSRDMWRASLFFSTNRVCGHTHMQMHTFTCVCSGHEKWQTFIQITKMQETQIKNKCVHPWSKQLASPKQLFYEYRGCTVVTFVSTVRPESTRRWIN